MEKEALAYAVELAEPHIKEVNGEFYSDKVLKRLVHNPKAEAIKLTTLRSWDEQLCHYNMGTKSNKQ